MNSHSSQSRGSTIIEKVSKDTFSAKRERAFLCILLSGTTLLYAWGLDQNGWANSYYSAAAMSGAENWTAFLFGSSDPANAISVDKPPGSLWIMALSIRVFGLSSWSILLPQALLGVLSVYLLYKLVRDYLGPVSGLTAGGLMAITPVATAMFRYNNPDALLCLVMIGIAYATLTSIRQNRVSWLLVAGGLVGAGFLTKQLQIVLITPAMGATYLGFAQGRVVSRFINLVYCGLVAALAGGWWLILVQLTDSGSRPFVGGSSANSAAELTLGYNGLERLTGSSAQGLSSLNELGSGFQRFLQPGFTGQFGWFLPLAAAGTVVVSVRLLRRCRTQISSEQAILLVFSIGWLVVALTVLAFMSGIVHPYYGLTAVPPMCILATYSLESFLQPVLSWPLRSLFIVALLASALIAYVSTVRSQDEFPGLPSVLLLLGAVTLALGALPIPNQRVRSTFSLLLVFTILVGPILWSINTALTGHAGAAVSAGPSILGFRDDDPSREKLNSARPAGEVSLVLGDATVPDVVDRLAETPSDTTWPAAIVGSESAANYQLATGRPIMPVGGFNGSDPFPTLEYFTELVDEKEVGALVVKNLPPATAESRGEAARIVAWVRAHYPVKIVDGTEYYDLSN